MCTAQCVLGVVERHQKQYIEQHTLPPRDRVTVHGVERVCAAAPQCVCACVSTWLMVVGAWNASVYAALCVWVQKYL